MTYQRKGRKNAHPGRTKSNRVSGRFGSPVGVCNACQGQCGCAYHRDGAAEIVKLQAEVHGLKAVVVGLEAAAQTAVSSYSALKQANTTALDNLEHAHATVLAQLQHEHRQELGNQQVQLSRDHAQNMAAAHAAFDVTLVSARMDLMRTNADSLARAKSKAASQTRALTIQVRSLRRKCVTTRTQTQGDWKPYVRRWVKSVRSMLMAQGRSEAQIVAIGQGICADAVWDVCHGSGSDQAKRKRQRLAEPDLHEIVRVLDFSSVGSPAIHSVEHLYRLIGEHHPVLEQVKLAAIVNWTHEWQRVWTVELCLFLIVRNKLSYPVWLDIVRTLCKTRNSDGVGFSPLVIGGVQVPSPHLRYQLDLYRQTWREVYGMEVAFDGRLAKRDFLTYCC